MNKTIISYIAIAVIAFVPAVVLADPTPSPVSTPPATSDSGSTATPPTSGSGSTATPPTSGSSSTATTPAPTPISTPPVSGSSSTATPPTPVTPPSNNGGSSSGSSSSGSSSSYSSGGSRRAFGYCAIITGNMKYGANNNVNEVIALQNFLKNVERLNVDVNGTFDLKTRDAVIAFQNKYSDVVLAPWGLKSGSGYVYITTIKKINQIACNQPLTLNANELSIINSYKNRIVGAAIISVSPNDNTVTNEIILDGSTDTDNQAEDVSDTTSIAKPSILSRFWNFLVYLFR